MKLKKRIQKKKNNPIQLKLTNKTHDLVLKDAIEKNTQL
jgi:hypothetical protein